MSDGIDDVALNYITTSEDIQFNLNVLIARVLIELIVNPPKAVECKDILHDLIEQYCIVNQGADIRIPE